MICEKCGEREADIMVSHVDRERTTAIYLCGWCGRAKETGHHWLDTLRSRPLEAAGDPDDELGDTRGED